MTLSSGDLAGGLEEALGLVLCNVREQGQVSWQSPGHVTAAGYAAGVCSPCLSSSGCSKNPMFSMRSLSCHIQYPFWELSWAWEAGPVRGGIGGAKLGGRALETCLQEEWWLLLLPVRHLSPSIPSSSNLHALFSWPDCAINFNLPFAPYMALLPIFLPGFAPLNFMCSSLCVLYSKSLFRYSDKLDRFLEPGHP